MSLFEQFAEGTTNAALESNLEDENVRFAVA
jgi:hypothetical protein